MAAADSVPPGGTDEDTLQFTPKLPSILISGFIMVWNVRKEHKEPAKEQQSQQLAAFSATAGGVMRTGSPWHCLAVHCKYYTHL